MRLIGGSVDDPADGPIAACCDGLCRCSTITEEWTKMHPPVAGTDSFGKYLWRVSARRACSARSRTE